MLKAKHYNAILAARRRGLSIRAIARRLHHCRETVTKVLDDPTPKSYARKKCTRRSALEQYRQIIVDKIHSATDDLGVCSTTGAEIFRFLRDLHGYKGSEDQVWAYIRTHNLLNRRIRTLSGGHKNNPGSNIPFDVLRALCSTSVYRARHILEDIAQLDLRNLSQNTIKNLQNRIKLEYLYEQPISKGIRNRTHVSFPLFFRFLFRNEIPSELRNMFNPSELPSLKRLLLSKSLMQRKQAATIVLCKKGLSHTAIADTLISNKITINKYWRCYKQHGFDGLGIRRKMPRKADNKTLQKALITLLHSPPSSHGINRTSWTLKYLRKVLKSQGLSVGTEVLREIIKSTGCKWRRASRVLMSNDPEYKQKLNRIKSILSTLGRKDRFFSIDEWGPFYVRKREGKRLVAPGEHPSVPQFQKSKGSLIMTAALELSTNQITHFYSEKKNTGETIKLLNLLLKKYKRCKNLYLSWDAAAWHSSNALYETLNKVNGTAYRKEHHTPKVEIVPLPASAQFLNVIESVFSGLSRAIIHNSDYGSVKEVMSAIDRYIDARNKYFQKHPKRAGNKIWGKELVPCTFSEAQNCKDPTWGFTKVPRKT